MQLIASSQQISTKWAGGTTTQLFIYPLDASLEERNFDFRISTAQVEIEESTFSSFIGYHRQLMILDGKIEIHHQNQYSKTLNKLDVDEFNGSWETTAKGKCRDFNVITSKDYAASLKINQLNKDEIVQKQIKSAWYFLYLYTGKVQLEFSTSKKELKSGDLMVVAHAISKEIKIKGLGKSEVLIVEINHI